MSTRRSILALAALATLSAAALAPTSASALGFGGHFGGAHFGSHFGGVHFGGDRFGWRFGDRFGSSHLGSGIHICPLTSGSSCPPLPRPTKPWPPRYTGFPHYWPHYEPRYGYGIGLGHGPVVATGAGAASAPASNAMASSGPSRGCLTKQELPDGSALFRDLCTQEEAEYSRRAARLGKRSRLFAPHP